MTKNYVKNLLSKVGLFFSCLLLVVLVVSCKQDEKKYSIYFYDNTNLVATIQTSGNEEIDLPQAPNKTNYSFVGWFLDEGSWEKPFYANTLVSQKLESDIYVYAKYVLNEEPMATCKVTFVTNGGSLLAPVEIKVGTKLERPENPTRDGYEFSGWFKDESLTLPFNFVEEVIREDITLYAKWQVIVVVNTYTVNFETNGGSSVASIVVEEGKTFTCPAEPTKLGHTFKGWYSDSNLETEYDFATAVVSNLTLYAKWEKKTYQVSFETNGGTLIETVEVKFEEKLTMPNSPTKDGFNFEGWFVDENLTQEYDFNALVTQDLVLYAKWTSIGAGDVTFTIDENGNITSVFGIDGLNEITIPEVVDGKVVKGIYQELFMDNQSVERIVLPSTIERLGYRSFYNCRNLSEINLVEGITTIPNGAFANCVSLTNITFPTSLNEIREDAFKNTRLTNVTFSGSFINIWSYAFSEIPTLESVDFNNVQVIGDGAFSYCKQLKSVIIAPSVKVIEGQPFYMCSELTTIDMPNSVVSIDYSFLNATAYYDDVNNWINGILYVDGFLVTGGEELIGKTAITIKDGTICIANNAFSYYGGGQYARNTLVSVTLPAGLLSIGNKAFSGLTKLSSFVAVPDSLVNIGYDVITGTAYYANSSNWFADGLYLGKWLIAIDNVEMTTFTVKDGTIGIADASDADFSPSLFPVSARAVSNIVLPKSLKYIGMASFAYTKISTISLPSGLLEIGKMAFANCSNLEMIDLKMTSSLQSIGAQAFRSCPLTTITIPASVIYMDELVFNGNKKELVVNCLVEQEPSTWNSNWKINYSGTIIVNYL